MITLTDKDEILFDRLQSALAKLDAAFPAGDYRLNKWQNDALNEILDVSFDMAQKMPNYRKKKKAAMAKALERKDALIKEMRKNGLL